YSLKAPTPEAHQPHNLTCSVCLSLFTEPVTLFCGHSFCRECISSFLSSQQCCPQCRSDVSMKKTPLTTNHALKSLAERAKENERIKKESGTDSQVRRKGFSGSPGLSKHIVVVEFSAYLTFFYLVSKVNESL
uniref:RING-type domain-containing protein n=1 Tax=Oryzias sinensis TaxID=183150 RepID=A0A8C7X1C3_9TELE